MAALTSITDASDVPEWVTKRSGDQAAKLVKLLDVSKPFEKLQAAAQALPAGVTGDHPVPQGQFVSFLFQPFVWPTDSESDLAAQAHRMGVKAQQLENDAEDIRQYIFRTFDGGLWVGEGADAARAAYERLAKTKIDHSKFCSTAQSLLNDGSTYVRSIKKLMYKENTDAHQEVEKYLRSGSVHSIAQVAVILTTHRTTIQVHSATLHTDATQLLGRLTAKFPEDGANNGNGNGHNVKEAGNSDGTAVPGSSDGGGTGTGLPGSNGAGGTGASPVTPSSATDGGGLPTPSQLGVPPLGPSSSSDLPLSHGHNPLSSLLGAAGGGMPSLPSLPGLGSGGGGGMPFSGLQGLMGGFPGGGGMMSPAGLGGGFQAPPALPNLGMSFGQGLAAGASAAGAVPSVPQASMAPLMAPLETGGSAAAPAAAISAPSTPPSVAGGAGVGGSEGMTSYGSVLPPAGTPAAGMGAGGAAGPGMPAESGAPSPAAAAAGAGTGLMPVGARERDRVSRKVAESDLAMAKMAVAELAGAAAVTDPGLDWAVAVGHNSSGMPTYWVATNDGATYIPPGVFLRTTMPIAAGLNDAFDTRWMGWVNPAEKAVRAAREFGDTVGAVATTWAWPSEYLTDHPAVPEIATGVAPSMAENMAAKLERSRSHRLQTVNPALYADLKALNEDALRGYCRDLTQHLAFGVAADELTPVAQAVAHAVIAQQSPKVQEWAALGAEYELAQTLTGAQRPGLNSVEDADQVAAYCREFIRCRRMEALLCWEQFGGDLLNVVYAAWVAGIRAPLKEKAFR